MTLTSPIRSMLFVPGNRVGWIEKAAQSGADAITLDLEDSVPDSGKAEARQIVSDAISRGVLGAMPLYARTNKSPYIYDYDDVQAVVQPGLRGVFVSKADGPEDVDLIARMVAEAEHRRNMKVGGVALIVPIETARASELAFPIASHPRVETLVACAARNADVARALGFTWTPEGLETIYHRSRAITACRAAGKTFPIGGLWQDVRDLRGLRAAAEFNKRLGFRGEVVLHPSNIPIVNAVYSLNAKDRAYYTGLIAAFEKAAAGGKAALIYEGEHIDVAHAATAREILATWPEEQPA